MDASGRAYLIRRKNDSNSFSRACKPAAVCPRSERFFFFTLAFIQRPKKAKRNEMEDTFFRFLLLNCMGININKCTGHFFRSGCTMIIAAPLRKLTVYPGRHRHA